MKECIIECIIGLNNQSYIYKEQIELYKQRLDEIIVPQVQLEDKLDKSLDFDLNATIDTVHSDKDTRSASKSTDTLHNNNYNNSCLPLYFHIPNKPINYFMNSFARVLFCID